MTLEQFNEALRYQTLNGYTEEEFINRYIPALDLQRDEFRSLEVDLEHAENDAGHFENLLEEIKDFIDSSPDKLTKKALAEFKDQLISIATRIK